MNIVRSPLVSFAPNFDAARCSEKIESFAPYPVQSIDEIDWSAREKSVIFETTRAPTSFSRSTVSVCKICARRTFEPRAVERTLRRASICRDSGAYFSSTIKHSRQSNIPSTVSCVRSRNPRTASQRNSSPSKTIRNKAKTSQRENCQREKKKTTTNNRTTQLNFAYDRSTIVRSFELMIYTWLQTQVDTAPLF